MIGRLLPLCLFLCANLSAQNANLEFVFMQFSGCEGNRTQELIGLYSQCGFEVNDLIIRFDKNFNSDSTGLNGDINDSGTCGWIVGDTSVFTGCSSLHAAGPGDFIPAHALVVIQLTQDIGEIKSLETQCQTGLPIYVIRNNCLRTMEAFPELRSENYQLEMQLQNFPSIVFDAKFRDDRLFWTLPLVQFNKLGQRSGSNCDNPFSNTWDHLINPNLAISDVVVQQPNCIDLHGSIEILTAGPIGDYSIDGGLTWSEDSIFEMLDTGFYEILIRDTSEMCPTGLPDRIPIKAYENPSILNVTSEITTDSICSHYSGSIQIETSQAGALQIQYSNDDGVTFSNSPFFDDLGEGTYHIKIRDSLNPQCLDSLTFQVGPFPIPLELTGINKDSISPCESGEIEIQAVGQELLYSIDGVAFHYDSIVILDPNEPYTLFIKEAENSACIDSLEVVLHQTMPFLPDVNISGSSAEFVLLRESRGPYFLSWSTGDTTVSVHNLPVGLNYLDVTDGWGCSQRIMFFVDENSCVFHLTDSIVDATCETSTTSIYLVSNDSTQAYEYDWNIDSFDGLPYIKDVNHGSYYVDVSYGDCSVRINFETPIGGIDSAEIQTSSSSCSTPNGTLEIIRVRGGTGPYTLGSGEVFDSSISILGLSSGLHPIAIRDQRGCIYYDTIMIDSDTFSFDLNPIVRVDNCVDYLYTLDFVNLTSTATIRINNQLYDSSTISDLTSGIYSFEIMDSNGCTNILEINLNPPPFIQIPADTMIQQGEDIELHAKGDLAEIDSFHWTGERDPICNCIQTSDRPDSSITYSFHYVDKFGCLHNQEFKVNVLNSDLFIPNAFSPNHDDINDTFRIYTENLEVVGLSIFDRWGNMLFDDLGPDFEWNGVSNGKRIDPGVYIFKVQFRNENDEYFTRSGTVTLIK